MAYRVYQSSNGTDFRFNEDTGVVRASAPGDPEYHHVATVNSYEDFLKIVEDDESPKIGDLIEQHLNEGMGFDQARAKAASDMAEWKTK